MIQNLRILDVSVIDSITLEVKFTANLNTAISISNFAIESQSYNVANPEVLSVKISSDTAKIVCQPLTHLALYNLVCKSTDLIIFNSVNNDAILFEDGTANVKSFLGPQDQTNQSKEFLKSFYKDNLYNIDDTETLVSKYITGLSVDMSRALHDIGQAKSDNYISLDIVDETKVRGDGPFDRLNVEGAYEVTRVGLTKTGSTATKTISFDEFPTSPVSLGKESSLESLSIDSENTIGKFNINTLTLTLNNKPISKLISVNVYYSNATPTYTYDIAKYGYQVLENKYDKDYAFKLYTLENNQIKLSDKLLEDPNFLLDNILRVDVSYEYNDLGIIVDSSTITATTTLQAVRETLEPIVNIFDLKHNNIVDSNGNVVTLGAVTFIDVNSLNGAGTHPAFKYEIQFRQGNLPSMPGQYAIDYSSGRVYVYGQDSVNDGTGPYPPLATYYYVHSYTSEIDYVYDDQATDVESANDFVALPTGSLVGEAGTISFKFEKVFVPNIDYKAQIHTEVLSERIENRLVAPTVIKTVNSPITSVFRVYNETSGEIYRVSRFNNDKIYISYNNAPSIKSEIRERASFELISNELLFVNDFFLNGSSIKIFNILLKNSNVTSATDDCIGSSINSSATFSNKNIFINEKWFNDKIDLSLNTDNLSVGEYIIDYKNGQVYVAVSNTQDYNIGTASYKTNKIQVQNPHLISVEDIYYNINLLQNKDKQFKYSSFDEGYITPQTLARSDESFLNGDDTFVYQLNSNMVGVLTDTGFVEGVTDSIKSIRGLFEKTDLFNNTLPLNFATYSSFDKNIITVGHITQSYFTKVKYDGANFYVDLNLGFNYISTNINYDISIIRSSDSAELWDNSGTITPGSTVKLILSGVNSPVVDDLVNLSIDFSINDLSLIIVDYNKGDYYVDYTYLADEIIISYEHGDNVIDFRQSNVLTSGETYYVSYKAGALRTGLFNNFGNLINIPILTNFNVDFNRERYRDAVTAALTSFIQGPTVNAIKNIGNKISHITPEVIESIFDGWSLGTSILYPKNVESKGEFPLLPAKYDNGVLINDNNQSLTLPVNSNFRLEEGTFESWIVPQWNGLDNDAELTITIQQDGYAIDSKRIFIGEFEDHPQLTSGKFKITKNIPFGTPSKNKDGIYIYYDKDSSGLFNRWYLEVVDGYTDGYLDEVPSRYKIRIDTNGEFYSVKTINPNSNSSIFTAKTYISYNINSGNQISQGFSFISDIEHYLLDFGDKDKNRLSIYKDVSGYLVFKVIDKYKNPYVISYDVSSWANNDPHYIAASWKIGNVSNMDEMHLFIDGFEVPNIVRYGQKTALYPHEKFRTVAREDVVGLLNRDIISATDLVTTLGSNVVTSLTDFGAYNIFAGDTIHIDEEGFNPSGYTISTVVGQTLTLSSTMPASITNGRFTLNRTSYTVTSEIDLYKNFYVSTISDIYSNNNLDIYLASPYVTSATNFTTLGVLPGYLIRIDSPNTNTFYNILEVNGTTLTLDDNLPATLTGLDYYIYKNEEVEIPGKRALRPSYTISKDVNFNNILTLNNNVYANDLVIIRTLGLSFRKVKGKHYVWSNTENIIPTFLAPPVSLDEVNFRKIILDTTMIGPTTSVEYLGSFIYTLDGYADGYETSNSQIGRTLTVTIAGNNVDFSTPTVVTITGLNGSNLSTIENISFTDYGSLDTINTFISISNIVVTSKPISLLKNACVVDIKEKYSIIKSESSSLYARVNYSYQTKAGTTLQTDGYSGTLLKDDNKLFSMSDIGNFLVITAPLSAAGYYKIINVTNDLHSIEIEDTIGSFPLPLSTFSNGTYYVLQNNSYRSGYQNGFFIFEQVNLPGEPYFLTKGLYDIEYYTWLNIKIDPLNKDAVIGNSIIGSNNINSLVDNVITSTNMLTDKRIGETSTVKEINITKNYNSIKPPKLNKYNLAYVTFDEYPFINDASYYVKYKRQGLIEKDSIINDTFSSSALLDGKPIVLDNDGILDTRKEATIEFWMNPIFETYNDHNFRYYFDAYGATAEEVVSSDNSTVSIVGKAKQILSVSLVNADKNNYFTGGELSFDYSNVISENLISSTTNSVTISNPALQIISVKIVGDLQNKDYFNNGIIDANQKTIYLSDSLPSSNINVQVIYKPIANTNGLKNKQVIRLGKKLPAQNALVKVVYIPEGLQGDRISLFKDPSGYFNFQITASNIDYVLRSPILFSRNTPHRIKASYKVNSNNDQMRLWIDGYEIGSLQFGEDIIFNESPYVFGGTTIGSGGLTSKIKFKDPINTLIVGADFKYENSAMCIFDNLRVSDIFRPLYAPYGENIDVNYSSNLAAVYPVTKDLYTTYLLDFDNTLTKFNDFTVLRNKSNGNFDFTVNIIDSFDIVSSSDKVKEILETLIKTLKPGCDRVYINYK